MAEPPKSPPSSDIEGVNRDARIGTPRKDPQPDPGAELDRAGEESAARPDYDSVEDE